MLKAQISLKSLKVFQIYFGIILVIDLLSRVSLLNFFYGSLDFSNRFAALGLLFPLQSWLVLGCGIIAAIALSLRKQKLLSLGLLNLVYLYFYFKNPYIADTGDKFIRILLIWSLLFEIEFRLSENFDKNDTAKTRTSLVSNFLVIQIGLIYLCTGLLKFNSDWLVTGQAAYNFVHLKMIRHDFWNFAFNWPSQVFVALSFSAAVFEFLGGLLILLLPQKLKLRKILCGAFLAFHLCISLFANVGMISWIAMSFWILLWPANTNEPSDFNFLQAFRKKQSPSSFILNLLAGIYGATILVGNLYSLSGVIIQEGPVAKALLINQHWSMFAPRVEDKNYWLSAKASFANAKQFDLWQKQSLDGKPAEPSRFFQSFFDYRWMVYAMKMIGPTPSKLAKNLASYLCQTTDQVTNGRLETLEISLLSSKISEPSIQTEFTEVFSPACTDQLY